MELHLPGSVCATIVKEDEVITVTRSSPEGTRTFVIEKERLFELIDDKRTELRTDEYSNEGLMGLIETIGVLIESGGGLASWFLFQAIFLDLIAGKPLSWIPPGHYYFSDGDGAIFMVFSSKELLDKYLRYERYEEDPDLNPEDDPDYDEMEGFPEIEHQEYFFPYSSSGYHDKFDVRLEFQHEFF